MAKKRLTQKDLMELQKQAFELGYKTAMKEIEERNDYLEYLERKAEEYEMLVIFGKKKGT